MANVGYSKIISQNPELEPVNGRDINTYVETSLFYIDGGAQVNLIRKRSKFRPTLGAGLGALIFIPKDINGEALSKKKSSRAPDETYGTLALTIPTSLGMEIILNPKLRFHLTYTYRMTTTDYIDNIGELGQKSGFDQLHGFKFGVNLTLQQGQKQPEKPKPAFTPEDSILASAEEQAESNEEFLADQNPTPETPEDEIPPSSLSDKEQQMLDDAIFAAANAMTEYDIRNEDCDADPMATLDEALKSLENTQSCDSLRLQLTAQIKDLQTQFESLNGSSGADIARLQRANDSLKRMVFLREAKINELSKETMYTYSPVDSLEEIINKLNASVYQANQEKKFAILKNEALSRVIDDEEETNASAYRQFLDDSYKRFDSFSNTNTDHKLHLETLQTRIQQLEDENNRQGNQSPVNSLLNDILLDAQTQLAIAQERIDTLVASNIRFRDQIQFHLKRIRPTFKQSYPVSEESKTEVVGTVDSIMMLNQKLEVTLAYEKQQQDLIKQRNVLLAERIERTEQELRQSKDELLRLRKEREKLKNTNTGQATASLLDRISETQDQVGSILSETRNIQDDIASHQTVDSLYMILEQQETLIVALNDSTTKQFERYENYIDQIERRLANLGAKNESQNLVLEQYKRRVNELEAAEFDLKYQEVNNDGLVAKLKEAKDENKALKERIEQMMKAPSSEGVQASAPVTPAYSAEERDKLINQIKVLTQGKESQKARIASLEQETARQTTRIKELRAENNRLQANIAPESTIPTPIPTTAFNQQQIVDSLNLLVVYQKNKISTLEYSLGETEKALVIAKEAALPKDKEPNPPVTSTPNPDAQLTFKVDSLLAENKEKEKSLQLYRTNMEKLEATVERLNTQLEEQPSTASVSNPEYNSNEGQASLTMDSLRTVIQEQDEQLTSFESQIKQLRKTKAQLQNKISEQEASIQASTEPREGMTQADSLYEILVIQKKRIKSLEAALDEGGEAYTNYIQYSETKLDSLITVIDELRSQKLIVKEDNSDPTPIASADPSVQKGPNSIKQLAERQDHIYHKLQQEYDLIAELERKKEIEKESFKTLVQNEELALQGLMKDRTTAEAELKAVQNELFDLQRKQKKLEEQGKPTTQYDQDIIRIKENLAGVKTERDSVLKVLENKQNHIIDLENEAIDTENRYIAYLKEAEARIETLQKENEALANLKNDFDNNNISANEVGEKLADRPPISTQTITTAALSNTQDSLRVVISSQTRQINTLNKALKKQEKEYDQYAQSIQSQLNGLAKENEGLNDRIDDYMRKIEMLELQNQKLKDGEDVASSTAASFSLRDKAKLEQAIDSLEQSNGFQATRIEALEASLLTSNEEHGGYVRDVEERVENLKKQNKNLEVKLSALESRSRKLELENSSLKEQMDPNQKFVETNLKLVAEKEEEISNQKAMISYLSAMNDSISEELNVSGFYNSILQDSLYNIRLALSRNQLEATDKQLSLEREKSLIEQRMDSLRYENDRLAQRVSVVEDKGEVDQVRLRQVINKETYLKNISEQLNVKAEILAQREMLMAKRITEIESSEEKFKYLGEKEKELILLEQKLRQNRGYEEAAFIVHESRRNISMPGIAVLPATDKTTIRPKVIDYFAMRGYSYSFEDGKLVFRNVILPQIGSESYDVFLYLMRDALGRTQLMGSFQKRDETFISEREHPRKSERIQNFLYELIQ